MPKNDAFQSGNLHEKVLAQWKGQRYLRDYMATIAPMDEGASAILDHLKNSGRDKTPWSHIPRIGVSIWREKGWFYKRLKRSTTSFSFQIMRIVLPAGINN
ncbi:MAG: hypothetical protein AAGA86_03810 [Bacteroidota bacterium]